MSPAFCRVITDGDSQQNQRKFLNDQALTAQRTFSLSIARGGPEVSRVDSDTLQSTLTYCNNYTCELDGKGESEGRSGKLKGRKQAKGNIAPGWDCRMPRR